MRGNSNSRSGGRLPEGLTKRSHGKELFAKMKVDEELDREPSLGLRLKKSL